MPEHDVAAVEARVAEKRRDAEERAVGVPDLHARREEPELMSRRLDEPDDCEEGRERDRDRRQAAGHPGRKRRACDDRHQHCEREEEVREDVLARVEIVRPKQRQRGDREEREAGTATIGGTRFGSRPRSAFQPRARAAAPSTPYSGSKRPSWPALATPT